MARAHPTTLLAVLIIAAIIYALVFYLPKPASDTDEKERDVDRSKTSHAQAVLHQHPKMPFGNLSTSPIINVMLCSDSNTLPGLIAAINSIRVNSKAHVRFYLVVDPDSVNHVKEWIEGSELNSIDYMLTAFNESWVKGKIPNQGAARKDLLTPLNFAKYYFPWIFPKVTGRIVFIDSDAVVQGDVEELSRISMRTGDAAAFSDDCSTVSNRVGLHQHNYASYINFESEKIKKLGFNPMKCSFNTGIFVANISLWKERRITEKLDYWLSINNKENIFGTQKGGGSSGPPMMIVFYEKYSQLPPEWNVRHLGVTSGTKYSDEFVHSAKLLHWNGRYKPWGRISQHTMVWEKFYIHDPTGQYKIARKYGNI
ncbi:glycosyltransferase 8 domain-containing protein 1-like [Amphiura filiformis]|uniref:glycosyltransferase 8 domain-containing protein 1-like n=1 Tax=Amphiura filiformis TaxID=82378 RepID=UPI003B219F0D